jgi:hypothetical protein
VRIGLIARSEYARGLAIQSKNFYDHMPVDKVLLVHMPNPDCALRDDWYDPSHTTIVDSLPGHTLDEHVVRSWMEGLDVVFTVETPYDWSLPGWAASMNVRLVIQGNPEFVRHGLEGYEHYGHPTQWWWPTRWRTEVLPRGRWMPVPMPDHPATAAAAHDGPLRVYHIAGKRAFADRNGTDCFINALRGLSKDVLVTLHGLEHSLPEIQPIIGLSVHVENIGVADLWDMHAGQHLLVLPRRYGGLCLPALEAASRGIAVMMPEVSPNDELASIRVPAMGGRKIRVAAGEIFACDVHHFALAQEINALNLDRDRLLLAQQNAYRMVPRWSEWRDRYLQAFGDLL